MFMCNRSLISFTLRTPKLLKSAQLPGKHTSPFIQRKFLINPISTRPLTTVEKTVFTGNTVSEDSLNKQTQSQEPEYNVITCGDKDLEHKLKVYMLEAEVMRQDGLMVPEQSFMTTNMWKELLKQNSRAARRKYLMYLYKTAKSKEKQKLKKLEKKQAYEEIKPELIKKSLPIEEHALTYGLQHNNIFLRIHDQTINRMENNKLFQAMRFGEKVVIDCGYDKNMTKRENKNCAKQLMLVFAENRAHKDPYDLHFCNINRESDLGQAFKRHVPTMDDLDFPLNVHEKSYLDLYPKEKLVYLTPHCQQDMVEFNPDEIYIIGAIVDKINNEPLSLAKAKREGIKMMKFPLDKYLTWGMGGKSLTLNQCVSILLDLKVTGNWEYALRHVPKRKLVDKETFLKNKSFSNKFQYANKFNNKPKWIPKLRIETVFEKD